MFAIENHEYPGDWFYRFQYYEVEDGEILRYDNAHADEDLGRHHRHVSFGEDSGIEFQTRRPVPPGGHPLNRRGGH
jgi:hypothetical protein